jgi:hypothetical protein
MRTATRRNPTLLDAVLLVGSAATGMGLFQWAHRSLFMGWIWMLDLGLPRADELTGLRVLVTGTDVMAMLIAIVAPWTFVVLVLRLRPPRPRRWRHLWRQPGTAACLAAVLAWCWTALAFLATLDLNLVAPGRVSRTFYDWLQKYLSDEIFSRLGLAVAVTWLVLALSGRWRRPVDWIDGLGLGLGGAWILIGFLWSMRDYLDLMN